MSTEVGAVPYYLTSRTTNTIGPDTDVMNGHRVEVVAVYGHYEPWTDHLGRPYTDHLGRPYMLSVGAPYGRPVFRGRIVNFEASYGEKDGVTVTLASHGMELSKGEPIKSGSDTTVTFTSTPIETIVKNILDTNPGIISYSTSTIAATGVSISAKFQLNTKLEGIKSVFDQTAAGWFWYGNVAENYLYLKPRNTVPDHIFYKGKHLSDVKISEDASDLRNRIYFVGGDTGSGILYKVFEDTSAIEDHGLGVYRITDRRFTIAASVQRYAEKIMSRYARPIYTSTITIPASDYNIEEIKIGDVIGFRNFGNFIDSQQLQVVSYTYTPTKVTLQIGEILDDQRTIVADLEEGLANEQYQEIPSAPS